MTDPTAHGIRQVPRAVFGFELQPDPPTRRELAELLKEGLSTRFGPVQARYPVIQRLYRQSMLILNANDREVLVSLLRDGSRPELPEYQREWMVLVDPFSGPIWQVFRPGSERGHESALLAVSSEIHTLLGNLPRIIALRWYFKGWDPKKPAMQTPTELPWVLKTPEPPKGS